MKQLCLFLAFLPLLSMAQQRFPIVKAKKWGYMNAEGKVVIPLKYEKAGGFSHGLAFVEVNKKLGYIDSTGKMVIAPAYIACGYFNKEGYAMVKKKESENWSVINRKGEIIGKEVAEAITPINQELFRQKEGRSLFSKWGYKDAAGRYFIKPQFEEAGDFSEDLAIVSEDGDKYGYINRLGEMVIPARYSFSSYVKLDGIPQFDPGNFSEGMAAVSNGEKWGFIDKTGRTVIDFIYEDAGPFSGGLACVRQGEKYGYVDTTGTFIIKPQYVLAEKFSEGLAAVGIGETAFEVKWGFIDRSGKLVIPATITGAIGLTENPSFKNGLTQVYLTPGVWGYVNKQGKTVWKSGK